MIRLLAFLTVAFGCRIYEEGVSMQTKSQRTGRSWMEMACGKLELHLSGTCTILWKHMETSLPAHTASHHIPAACRYWQHRDTHCKQLTLAFLLTQAEHAGVHMPGVGQVQRATTSPALTPSLSAPLTQEVPISQANELTGQKEPSWQLCSDRKLNLTK